MGVRLVRLPVVLLGLLLALPVLSATPADPGPFCTLPSCVRWSTVLDGPAHSGDWYGKTIPSHDGAHLYAIVSSQDANHIEHEWTQAFDSASGRSLWSSLNQSPERSYGIALAEAPDGTAVYSVGHAWTSDANAYSIITRARDAASGRELWAEQFDTANIPSAPFGSWDVSNGVAVSPTGDRVFVLGQRLPDQTNTKAATILLAYDALRGTPVWSTVLDSMGTGAASFLALTPDGSRLLVATSNDSGTASDFLTLAFDTFNGTVLWQSAYDGPAHFYDAPQAMTLSPDGNLAFVVGRATDGYRSEESWNTSMAIIAYDVATGNALWTTRYRDAGDLNAEAAAAALSPDGSTLYVTGWSGTIWPGVPPAMRLEAVALNATTGEHGWSYAANGTCWGCTGWAVASSPDGSRVAIVGETGNTLGDQGSVAVLRPSDGHEVWNSSAVGLVGFTADAFFAPDSSGLIVAGSTFSSGSSLDATVARFVDAPFGPLVTPRTQSARIGLLQAAAYHVRVQNAGKMADTFSFELGGVSRGWSATLTDETTGEPLSSRTLDTGQSIEAVLTVSPTFPLPEEKTSWANVTVTSEGNASQWDAVYTQTSFDPTVLPSPPSASPLAAGFGFPS
ncbi:MAG: hypothetical protein QOE90_1504 [Thermoplasmata archaeon]|jgi:DNA-binding beta-propeller fold protein YncE|nr:hypothetical protein [Thermoplasmata archaeon]